jgi:hypothetical protein
MHDAIRVKLRTFNGQLAMTQITREEVAALLADRDALAERLRAFEHEVMTGRSEQHDRLVNERDALARDLAAARELLHGLLAGVDEDCGDGGCDDCEAWRPIRAFLAATPEREPGAACTCIHPPGHPCEPAWDCPVHS